MPGVAAKADSTAAVVYIHDRMWRMYGWKAETKRKRTSGEM